MPETGTARKNEYLEGRYEERAAGERKVKRRRIKNRSSARTTSRAKNTSRVQQTQKPVREVNYTEYRLVEGKNGRLELQKQEIDDDARKQEREAIKKEVAQIRKQKEQRQRETREAAATRVSYVKKKLARRSLFSAGLLAAALVLGGIGVFWAVATKGQAPLPGAALVLCSLVLGLVALWYGCLSFLEKGRNYILARLCVGISGLLIISWGITIFIGTRG